MEALDGLKKNQDGYRYHGYRGTKIMGWDDVRYCFSIVILVIIIIIITTVRGAFKC